MIQHLLFFLALWSKVARDKNRLPLLPLCSYDFYENFQVNTSQRWTPLTSSEFRGKWSAENSAPMPTRLHEKALVMKTPAQTHAIFHKFSPPIVANNRTFIIQFETRSQFMFVCNYQYITIYSDPAFYENFNNKTLPFIEFGPERCFNSNRTRLRLVDASKVDHWLINPPSIPVDEITHLYQLIVRQDHSMEILIDTISVYNGSMARSFEPPLGEDAISLPNIQGIGFRLWAMHQDVAFSNIMIASDEPEIRVWNKRDFSIRQKKQIKVMKISYSWIDISKTEELPPIDLEESLWRKMDSVRTWWGSIKNKTAILIFALCAVLISLPVSILVCPCFLGKADKIKVD